MEQQEEKKINSPLRVAFANATRAGGAALIGLSIAAFVVGLPGVAVAVGVACAAGLAGLVSYDYETKGEYFASGRHSQNKPPAEQPAPRQ